MVPVLYPCKPPHCRFAPKGLSDNGKRSSDKLGVDKALAATMFDS